MGEPTLPRNAALFVVGFLVVGVSRPGFAAEPVDADQYREDCLSHNPLVMEALANIMNEMDPLSEYYRHQWDQMATDEIRKLARRRCLVSAEEVEPGIDKPEVPETAGEESPNEKTPSHRSDHRTNHNQGTEPAVLLVGGTNGPPDPPLPPPPETTVGISFADLEVSNQEVSEYMLREAEERSRANPLPPEFAIAPHPPEQSPYWCAFPVLALLGLLEARNRKSTNHNATTRNGAIRNGATRNSMVHDA